MKPRLRRAPLTDQDWAVWDHVNDKGPGARLYGYVIEADRRDADVMLGAKLALLCDCCQEQMSVMFFDGQQIDIRGIVAHP